MVHGQNVGVLVVDGEFGVVGSERVRRGAARSGAASERCLCTKLFMNMKHARARCCHIIM